MLGISKIDPPYVSHDVAQMARQMAQEIASDPHLDAARTWAQTLCIAYRKKQIGNFDAVIALSRELRHSRRTGDVL